MKLKSVALVLFVSLTQLSHVASAGNIPVIPAKIALGAVNAWGNLWHGDLEMVGRRQGERWTIKLAKKNLHDKYKGKGWCENAGGETGMIHGTNRDSVIASIKQELRNKGCRVT